MNYGHLCHISAFQFFQSSLQSDAHALAFNNFFTSTKIKLKEFGDFEQQATVEKTILNLNKHFLPALRRPDLNQSALSFGISQCCAPTSTKDYVNSLKTTCPSSHVFNEFDNSLDRILCVNNRFLERQRLKDSNNSFQF